MPCPGLQHRNSSHRETPPPYQIRRIELNPQLQVTIIVAGRQSRQDRDCVLSNKLFVPGERSSTDGSHQQSTENSVRSENILTAPPATRRSKCCLKDASEILQAKERAAGKPAEKRRSGSIHAAMSHSSRTIGPGILNLRVRAQVVARL
jgi:hypothetical protein